MQVQPYLFFNGRCAEAIHFYRTHLGATVTFLTRFKEAPETKMIPAGWEEKIMHANLKIGETEIMASDGQSDMPMVMSGCSLSISVATINEAERTFNALADGGTIAMPLQATFWASRFGMLTDRFGTSWMINCEHP